MGKRLKKILAVCCAATLMAAAPGMTVLASEYQEEALEEVIKDLSDESSVPALQDDTKEASSDSVVLESGQGETDAADEAAAPEGEADAADEAAAPEEEADAVEDVAAPEEETDAADEVAVPEEEADAADEETMSEIPGTAGETDLTEEETYDSEEELTGWSYVRFSDLQVGTNVTATFSSAGIGTGDNLIVSHVLTLTSNNGTLYQNWKTIIDDELDGAFTDWRKELTGFYIEETSASGKLHLLCGEYSEGTFKSFEKIESLDLSRVDTSSMVNMAAMFMDCKALKTLDLSNFNTSKVQSMSGMFSGCNALESLNVSSFNTSNVSDMGGMFEDCNSLKSLDLSSFDTSNVYNMHAMFSYCYGLKSLDVSSFDTSDVIYMDSMFAACSNLTHLDLSNFNTAKAVYMNYLFVSCYGLKYLDLSSFDMSSAEESADSGIWKMLSLDNYIETFKTPKKTNVKIELPREMYDGRGNAYTFVGPLTKSITVYYPRKLDIQYASVSGISLSYGYTGTQHSPDFKVKLDGKVLVSGTDYTFKFQNNLNPGTAKLIITGKGDYFGTKTRTFEIVDCVNKVVSGKTYQLIPKNNSKMAVCSQNGKMVNNTKLCLAGRCSAECMKFKAIKYSDGTWKFINTRSGLAMAVQQNSSSVGAGLVLYDRTTKKAQKWNLLRKVDNSFAIVNAVTGYSVSTTSEAAKDSTLSMAETKAVGRQRFYLVETTAISTPYEGNYSVRASKNSSYAVDITGASKDAGANVQLYSYNGTNAQKFNIMYSGAGYYRLINANSGLVISVKGNTKTDGANVIQSKWAGQNGQRWKITKNSDGTVTFKNVYGTVLHLTSNSIKNGSNIVARNASTTGAQKWYLKKF